MDNPLDVFQHLYTKARRTLEGERAYEQRQAYLREKQKLDEEHAYTLKQRSAIEERRITLAMASSASILMKLSGAQPDHWLYDEPVYETRGWLRKREIQIGTRQQIALEGWALDIEQGFDQDFFQKRYFPVLTADENINGHPPLVWYGERGNATVTKRDIHPLSTIPLSVDDMPWAAPQENRSGYEAFYPHTYDGAFIRPEPDEKRIEQLEQLMASGTPSTRSHRFSELLELKVARNNADYDTYKKVRAERRVQNAIAQVAARYDILNLK